MNNDIPPGRSFNPSAWSHRLPVLALALAGCGIATYLTLYQLDVIAHVWEPFFHSGSRVILKESSIARLLPVPDALIGAVVYLLDATLNVVGGPARWRTAPWVVLLLGAVAASLAAGGILLAIAQPLFFGAYCTLCLASAACSVLMVWPVMVEVGAAYGQVRRETAAGKSLRAALRGTP